MLMNMLPERKEREESKQNTLAIITIAYFLTKDVNFIQSRNHVAMALAFLWMACSRSAPAPSPGAYLLMRPR